MESTIYFNDIEMLRTPEQMKEYFELKREQIKGNPELLKLARLKTGLFKQFMEEFYYLYCFSQSQFCNPDSLMRIVCGNQPYDAIIYNNNDPQKYEFTCYIDGKFEFEDAKKLNQTGMGDIRFHDIKSLDERAMDYLDIIMKNIDKKSHKNYEGVDLVIVVNTFYYFELWGNSSSKFVRQTIKLIKQKDFKAKNIYLIILNNEPIEMINKNIYLVK